MTSTVSPSPSRSRSVSAKSSEKNLLSILSLSASPSPSHPPNPNPLTASLAPTNPDPPLPASSSPPLSIIPPPTPACSACKYQRRKCGPTCPLAPYFPAGRNQQFMNVHRLFGVSNVVKTLKGIQPSDRQKAVETLIFEADTRARDPAGGCLRIVIELEKHLKMLNDELTMVNSHLALYKAQAASTGQGVAMANPPNDQNHQNEGYQVGSAIASVEEENQNPEIQQEQRFFDYFSYEGNNNNYNANNMSNNTNDNNNLIDVNSNINSERIYNYMIDVNSNINGERIYNDNNMIDVNSNINAERIYNYMTDVNSNINSERIYNDNNLIDVNSNINGERIYNDNNMIDVNNNINKELIEFDINGPRSDGHHVEDHNEERDQSGHDDVLRPFVDIFGLCNGNNQDDQEVGQELGQNGNGDVAGRDRALDMPLPPCDLGLGFSSF